MSKSKRVEQLKQKQVQNRRIRVQFDIEYKGSPGKEIKAETQTVPDLNLTVRQLMDNYTRSGESGAIEHTPLYFEQEIPTITDMSDIQQLRDHLDLQIQKANEFIKAQENQSIEEVEEAVNNPDGKPIIDNHEQPPVSNPASS